jgi:hypothetical protein
MRRKLISEPEGIVGQYGESSIIAQPVRGYVRGFIDVGEPYPRDPNCAFNGFHTAHHSKSIAI